MRKESKNNLKVFIVVNSICQLILIYVYGMNAVSFDKFTDFSLAKQENG